MARLLTGGAGSAKVNLAADARRIVTVVRCGAWRRRVVLTRTLRPVRP